MGKILVGILFIVGGIGFAVSKSNQDPAVAEDRQMAFVITKIVLVIVMLLVGMALIRSGRRDESRRKKDQLSK